MSLIEPITKKELLKNIEHIDGLLSNEEAWLLYKLATNAVDGAIVEIGSFKGKSTICLAHGTHDGFKQRIYAIDPHMGDLSYHEWELHKNAAPSKEEFIKNIKNSKVGFYAYPLFATSQQAFTMVKQKVSLVFIDGDHRYEGVLSDYKNWKKKMPFGGVMAFHDSFSWEGVIKTIDNHVFKDKEFVCTGFANSITYFEKVNGRTYFDSFRNYFWSGLRLIYVEIVFMHLPKWILKPLKIINSLLMKIISR